MSIIIAAKILAGVFLLHWVIITVEAKSIIYYTWKDAILEGFLSALSTAFLASLILGCIAVLLS